MATRRAKLGNKGELSVKQAYRRLGYEVRDSSPSEPACDLYVFHRSGQLYAEVEVKFRKGEPYDMLPKEKRSIARRAQQNRDLNWPYLLHWITRDKPSEARMFTVGHLHPSKKRAGISLDLYEAGLLNLDPSKRAPSKGLSGSPLPSTEPALQPTMPYPCCDHCGHHSPEDMFGHNKPCLRVGCHAQERESG